ncbi:hypothetical protein [Sandaracinobacteroides hominis]|uniref:hypothetical protein n=1 Tax=Sandaracinobacteroides hominis TaxID=2780086 RepID=UPI0018F4B663|nr:hypothetical protein [Sandaracinobacteroides hominis]
MIQKQACRSLLHAALVAAVMTSSASACDMHGYFGGWDYAAGSAEAQAARAQMEADRIAAAERARKAFLSRFSTSDDKDAGSAIARAPGDPDPLPEPEKASPVTASYPR